MGKEEYRFKEVKSLRLVDSDVGADWSGAGSVEACVYFVRFMKILKNHSVFDFGYHTRFMNPVMFLRPTS